MLWQFVACQICQTGGVNYSWVNGMSFGVQEIKISILWMHNVSNLFKSAVFIQSFATLNCKIQNLTSFISRLVTGLFYYNQLSRHRIWNTCSVSVNPFPISQRYTNIFRVASKVVGIYSWISRWSLVIFTSVDQRSRLVLCVVEVGH